MNAVDIEQAISELAGVPFDPAEFPYAFLRAFGNKETTLKKLRAGAGAASSDVPGATLQRGHIHLKVCVEGEVDAALKALRDSPKTATAKARFLLATDGVTFQAEDLHEGIVVHTPYTDFPDRFGVFLPLAGISTVKEIKESSFDIKATGRLNRLYIELLKDNPDWARAERRPDMNHFMARLIFCFFAEDTGIFHGDGVFTATIEQMSAGDSSNTHEVIGHIFAAMNTPTKHNGNPDNRYRDAAGIRPWANTFPYVNGGLFETKTPGNMEVPVFSRLARSYLLSIGKLNWKKINPDIFGSMIQAVADDDERGALGMHYTSVPNILKVLNPLFLDDLREKLAEAGDNGRTLFNLRKRLARIRVFDPACGSGNFLVIAYKQMREIEAEVNRRRQEPDRRSDIPLTNFRGIELRDFPAEIARLALIIAEYQCDVLYRGEKVALVEFLPLNAENWIVCGNALHIDWLSVCSPTGTGVKYHDDDLFQTPLTQPLMDFDNEGGETYLCGNPPYVGSSKQSKSQKADLETIFDMYGVRYKNLDYISCWFWKASLFLKVTRGASAFVSTNSICQGEQVSLLWPALLSNGIEISFAQTAFKWSNLARNKAGVTCVVVGLRALASGKKYLYFEDTRREVSRINPYLIDFETVFIPRHSDSIGGLPKMLKGNQPTDGGNLILSAMEKSELVAHFPNANVFIRKLYGSKELIDGFARYCLWIEDELLPLAKQIPDILKRMEGVSDARTLSPAASTRARANISHRFIQIQDYGKRAIIVPEVSSEKRYYLPCGLLTKDEIATNKLFTIYNSDLYIFSLCSSRLHRIWAETVCGKLEERLSYSNVLGYNTFPLPKLTADDKAELTRRAEDILLAREAHYPKAIADLYDPDEMPHNLRDAHDRNDETLERIYIGRRFRNDTERLEHLFERYTQMTTAKAKTGKVNA